MYMVIIRLSEFCYLCAPFDLKLVRVRNIINICISEKFIFDEYTVYVFGIILYYKTCSIYGVQTAAQSSVAVGLTLFQLYAIFPEQLVLSLA